MFNFAKIRYSAILWQCFLLIFINNRLALPATQFPERYGGRSGDVQRIDIVRHRYAHHMVGCGNSLCWQSFALSAHDYRKVWYGCQQRVGNGDGVIGKGHGRCCETESVEFFHASVKPCPWYKEY